MRVVACLLLTGSLLQLAHAQKGTPLTAPEELTGIWETPEGEGAIGIRVSMSTELDSSAKQLASAAQSEGSLDVGVFERTGPHFEFRDTNFFSDSGNGGALWDGHRLQMHFRRVLEDELDINVDLTWDQGAGNWTGLFHRGKVNRQVVLTRPGSGGAPGLFRGTWANTDFGRLRCLHVGQQQGGSANGWSDLIQIPWLINWGRFPQPKTVLNQYGSVAEITGVSPGELLLQLNAYRSGGMPSPTLRAALSADARSFTTQEFGPERLPSVWTKQEGDSCTAAVQRSATPPS